MFRKCLLGCLLISSVLSANQMQQSFSEGMAVGKVNSGAAQNTYKGFNPSEIKGYQANPEQSQFYTGIRGDNPNISELGMKELSNSELGMIIRESTVNNPKDNISMDSDMIQRSFEINKNAKVISGVGGKQCVRQVIGRTSFTSHFCEKDNDISLICHITAKVRWEPSKNYVDRKYIVPFEYFSDGKLFSYTNNNPRLRIKIPVSGTLVNYRVLVKNKYVGAHCSRGNNVYSPQCAAARLQFDFFGKKAKMDYANMRQWKYSVYLPENYAYIIGGSLNRQVKLDEYYYGDAGGMKTYDVGKLLFTIEHVNAFYGFVSGVHQGKQPIIHGLTDRYLYDGQYSMELTIRIPDDPIPKVYYDNSCSEKSLEAAIKLEDICVSGKENRDFFKNGKKYSVYAECWDKRERYLVSEPSDNECKKYDDNPNCTVGERECIAKEGNDCIRHRIKYQCSNTTKTDGYVCGDKFFCSDGSCSDLENSVNTDFGHAVSQLATLAQAGKDVAFNPDNLRAFSGKAMFCRKTGFGFSNCCKDSGWGHKAGLAQCNSEENALGKAKEKNLVIYTGTYCDKKVLGKCIRKKSSYCVFDNKLARIIQYQGRSGQLGIGFGGAQSPNCRGLSVDELQRINFNAMDYSDFYEELNSNTKLPDQNQLIDYMKKTITDQLKQE